MSDKMIGNIPSLEKSQIMIQKITDTMLITNSIDQLKTEYEKVCARLTSK